MYTSWLSIRDTGPRRLLKPQRYTISRAMMLAWGGFGRGVHKNQVKIWNCMSKPQRCTVSSMMILANQVCQHQR